LSLIINVLNPAAAAGAGTGFAGCTNTETAAHAVPPFCVAVTVASFVPSSADDPVRVVSMAYVGGIDTPNKPLLFPFCAQPEVTGGLNPSEPLNALLSDIVTRTDATYVPLTKLSAIDGFVGEKVIRIGVGITGANDPPVIRRPVKPANAKKRGISQSRFIAGRNK